MYVDKYVQALDIICDVSMSHVMMLHFDSTLSNKFWDGIFLSEDACKTYAIIPMVLIMICV